MKRAMIRSMNFNCTIQELKQWKQIDEITEAADFNCTIQELKQGVGTNTRGWHMRFQLHHTGIKTMLTNKRGEEYPVISIAPYRN